MRPWRGVSLPGRGLGFCVMAFELTGQVEKHLVNDQIVWLTTVTPAGRPAPRRSGTTAITRPSASPQIVPGVFRSKGGGARGRSA